MKVKTMLRAASLCLLTLAATPVLANYGDIDAQLYDVRPETVLIAEPVGADDLDLATGDICALPLGLIVSLPDAFVQTDAETVACFSE